MRRALVERLQLGAAALALAASLLHPGLPMQRELVDHLVVLDVTQSMNVEDQLIDGRPASRLAHAKQALRHALLRLPCGSKLGLALFTEYRSFLLLAPVEVCDNLSELRSTLARMDSRMAWTGNSEIAKGLHSGLRIAQQLPDRPSIVFLTDGHESPPLNARHRPAFDGTPGEVRGLIVGVGGDRPVPIPKSDPAGRPLGYWQPDEVLQIDPRSSGRRGSLGNEAMVEDGGPLVPLLPGATPGSEHLSSLREAYLRMLAGELRLAFLRLDDDEAFTRALLAPALTRPVDARLDLATPLAALALVLLLARQAGPWLGFTIRRVGMRKTVIH